MSIQSEISRIRSNVSAAYDAVSELGGVVPEGENANSENLAEAIRTGAQALLSTKQDTLTGQPGQIVGFNEDGAAVAVQRWSNPNLLLNWDFRNPVNRNGKAEYTGARYGIDLWKGFSQHAKISVGANGLTVGAIDGTTSTITKNAVQFVHDFKHLAGKTITVSALVSHATGFASIFLFGASVSTVFGQNIGTYNGEPILLSFTTTLPNEIDGLQLHLRAPGTPIEATATFFAAKLELGSQQTLAHQDADGNWVLNDPPDYDLQYVLCSLYSPITGEWVGSQHSNPKLLINGYFPDPINQRGKKEYTGAGYTIDMWSITGANSSLTLEDDGICFLPSASSNGVRQYIEDPSALAGRTITMSILVGAENGTLVRCGCNDGALHYSNFVSSGIAEVTVSINENVEELFVFFQCDKVAKSPPIKAANLELGPIQTLAHKEGDTWVLNDPPPNKALELYRCSAFQFKNTGGSTEFVRAAQIETNGIFFDIPVLAPMRANPQIINPDALSVSTISYNMQTGFTFSAVALGSTLRIFASKANHGLMDASLYASGVLFDSNL